MKGTTEECLVYFLNRKTSEKDRQDFVSFIGISDKSDTLYRWSSGKRLPWGENLLRVRTYLTLHGYNVTEVEVLDHVVRDAGFIIAFNLATLDDFMNNINLPGHRAKDQAFGILFGRRGLSHKRREDISAFVALWQEQLDRKMGRAIGSAPRELRFGSPTPIKHAPVPAMPPAVPEMPKSKNELIKGLAYLILGMLPLTEYLLSDAFTAEDREKLRQMANGDGVFLLSNRLNRLCGERARRELKS